MVAEYEEREAALYCGYTWTAWAALPYFDRVGGVAQFRTHRLVDLHNAEAEAEYIERKRMTTDAAASRE